MASLHKSSYGSDSLDHLFNTLRLRQNGCQFPDDIFKGISWMKMYENFSAAYSLGSINNIPLIDIMAWRWSGGKPLSEPMMIILLTHICVTRPQWVH